MYKRSFDRFDLIDQLRYNIPQYVKNCLSDMNTSCYDTNQKKNILMKKVFEKEPRKDV